MITYLPECRRKDLLPEAAASGQNWHSAGIHPDWSASWCYLRRNGRPWRKVVGQWPSILRHKRSFRLPQSRYIPEEFSLMDLRRLFSSNDRLISFGSLTKRKEPPLTSVDCRSNWGTGELLTNSPMQTITTSNANTLTIYFLEPNFEIIQIFLRNHTFNMAGSVLTIVTIRENAGQQLVAW